MGYFDVFLTYITSSSLCPTQIVGLAVVSGLMVNLGSCNKQLHKIDAYGPSNIFNTNLYVKLYYDFCVFIYGGVNITGIDIVYFACILPYTIDGMNNLYLPRVNLNTASLFPGFVSLTTYLVDISTDESS